MAALIRKDIYLVGKPVWLMIAAALLFSFLPRMENLGSTALATMLLLLPLTTMSYDEMCHWDTYLAMMPCRPEKAVLSKYLFTAGMAASALVFLLLASCIQAAADGNLTELLVVRLSPLVMSLTVNAITMPTVYRFGVEKGRLVMIALLLVVFALLAGSAAFIGTDKVFGWIVSIPPQVLGPAAAAVAAANTGSFFLSVRFYKKRQSGAYN